MSAEHQIRDVIQIYFDCMFEASREKCHSAFHANAMITGYLGGELQEMDVAAFGNLVGSVDPSPKDSGEAPLLEVVSLDINGDTAVARVRDGYMGHVFLDTLSFLNTDGRWQIYNKLFHVES